jgi:hypothetical protein
MYRGIYRICHSCGHEYPRERGPLNLEWDKPTITMIYEQETISKLGLNNRYSFSGKFHATFLCGTCNTLVDRYSENFLLDDEVIAAKKQICGKCRKPLIQIPLDHDFSKHKCFKCNQYFKKEEYTIKIVD